ncbi:hypothetical protein Acr_13g0012440 [Actinidia rufa]|uniref:Uncharacterized protein n=1 Tax=Actinidia rufa TaxID=165716 RepID=A0A7J0FMB2_9ERIC|nr:hypothetical protein Acr_13g0012440 [Actinidia rufa]
MPHRYDHVYQSESSPNLRLPSNPAPESTRPKGATGATYYPAPAVQAVTNPNPRVAAKGGEDEEDVTSETKVEVDTELRLGRG